MRNGTVGPNVRARIVLVTGGASGIGQAVVRRLLAENASVIALDLRPTVLSPGDASVMPVIGDATSEADIARCVKMAEDEFGRLDGAVGAAGIAMPGTVTEFALSDWRRVVEVNLTSVFVLARHVLPSFVRSGGGSLVTIASQVGQVGYPRNAAYCAAKAGVINLMRSIAIDYGPQGIRANAVCPGPIDTPMTREAFQRSGEDYASLKVRVPAGRLGQPDEVAAACSYLLSDEAAYVNGTTLTIDGGYTAQ